MTAFAPNPEVQTFLQFWRLTNMLFNSHLRSFYLLLFSTQSFSYSNPLLIRSQYIYVIYQSYFRGLGWGQFTLNSTISQFSQVCYQLGKIFLHLIFNIVSEILVKYIFMVNYQLVHWPSLWANFLHT